MAYKRKMECFNTPPLKTTDSLSNVPLKLYPQERDWTCSIACIRSLLSAVSAEVPDEDTLVEKYSLIPGPHFSRDIKRLNILEGYDVIYGCDHKEIDFDALMELYRKGYYVMTEGMINYSHWLVFLGYFTIGEYTDPERNRVLFFDPYYNEIRILRADEFINMWIDGNHEKSGIERDFIAIKK